jgi:hypothetical protein
MPDAETHPQPCVQNEGMHARKSRKVRRTFRHSLRNGLPLIARSPRSPGLIASVALRNVSQRLDPSVGRSRPHALAVRIGCARLPRPTRPASYVRDDRDTPLLWRRDGKSIHLIWCSEKEKYFWSEGLTRIRKNQPVVGQITQIIPLKCIDYSAASVAADASGRVCKNINATNAARLRPADTTTTKRPIGSIRRPKPSGASA